MANAQKGGSDAMKTSNSLASTYMYMDHQLAAMASNALTGWDQYEDQYKKKKVGGEELYQGSEQQQDPYAAQQQEDTSQWTYEQWVDYYKNYYQTYYGEQWEGHFNEFMR